MKVVCVGGAQALRLGLALAASSASTTVSHWIPERGAGSERDMEALRGADKIVAIERGGLSFDFEALEVRAEVVRMAELALDFLWPFAGQPHIANALDDLYPQGPFPVELGDAWLNRALEGRRRAEAIAQDYIALDVARLVDLGRMKQLTLERQAELDDKYATDFASRIEDGFRQRPLFLNPRTPDSELFGVLARTVFARLGVGSASETEAAPQVRELPIHPSVARHFGLEWAQGRICVNQWGEPVDFVEYVHRYLAYSEGPELEQGLALIANLRADEAADRLEIAASRPMGRRTSSARRALARASVVALRLRGDATDLSGFTGVDAHDPDRLAALTSFARGRWKDAERALLACMAREPAKAEDFAALAAIREKLGDSDGRLAALELAVGLRPDDRPTKAQLTLALAARGELMSAIRSAKDEIALAPGDSRPCVVLVELLERAGWRRKGL